MTYNSQEEGYLRDEYYRHKREALKEGSLSLIKHFQGKDNFADRVVHEVEELFASKGGTLYDPQAPGGSVAAPEPFVLFVLLLDLLPPIPSLI